jgi:precorrin-6B methylase 2
MLRKIAKRLFPSRKKNPLIEIQALEMIRPVLDKFSIPVVMTQSALQPSALLTIQNDILLNGRRCIVETGSGVGTLYMAMVGKIYGLNLKVYSIEEDLAWIEIVRENLKKDALDSYVEFIHAPVDPKSKDKWYDPVVVGKVFETLDQKIDSLVIDGPKAYKKSFENARASAIDVLGPYLNDRCFVLIDDTHRRGERDQARVWADRYGMKFQTPCNTFSVATRGVRYNYLAF